MSTRTVEVGAASQLRADTSRPGRVVLSWARPIMDNNEATFAFRCRVLMRLIGRNYPGFPTRDNGNEDEEEERNSSWTQVAEGKEMLELTLDSLPPASVFQWRVQTMLIRGQGESSAIGTFTTQDALPLSPPRGVSAIEVGLDYVELSWKPPRFVNGCVTHYIIYYDIFGENTHQERLVPGDCTSFRVEHLFKQSCYRFQVAARTSAGEGPPSTIVFQETRASPLQAFLHQSSAASTPFSNPMKMTFVAGQSNHVPPTRRRWLFPLLDTRLLESADGHASDDEDSLAVAMPEAYEDADGRPRRGAQGGVGSGAMKQLLQKFQHSAATVPQVTASEQRRRRNLLGGTVGSALSAASRTSSGQQHGRGNDVDGDDADDDDDDTSAHALPLSNIPRDAPCCRSWYERGWSLYAGHIGLRGGAHYVVWIFRRLKPRTQEHRFAAEATCLQTRKTTSLVSRGMNAPNTLAARFAAVVELARIGGTVPPDVAMTT
ncbi:hypothetical protein PTSG_09380 [Salpingoeca rosetta]|uniref:Fibronectin type-III domain-containing protein n=1 Tax=Salpingoeca rosetta (strain ATCC 50818 / BSB-021) TaxID=946362 RepID=F2UMG4_SALR5|nr:uncharacterized protein PTSG_09380 [Salpingoeca rosetta]EGD78313.1 hypothetical protein PTSG_09380 [Salpingoeca rosetta]|eukprot:XP_004989636.1 hypothetical protein PTSG_09380 [Salpingoeca rosetta]